MIHVAYIIVRCPPLTSPNGLYRCNLGSDGVTSYEDICVLVCNTGYEVHSSIARICQSDGNWSGSNHICRRGIFIVFRVDFHQMYLLIVSCPSLTDPNNGLITCSLDCVRLGLLTHPPKCSLTDAQMIRKRRMSQDCFCYQFCSCTHTLQNAAFWVFPGSQKKLRLSGYSLG